ncbi:MAG: hypothetical protein AAFQ68_07155 [Bacteroidota bacterium]
MKQILPFVMLALIGLSACKSTKRAYQKGDYETAIFNSIERLRKIPNNKKARQTLSQAYPDFLTYMQDNIDQAKISGDQLRWEEVAGYYNLLNRVYDDIQRSPAAKEVIRNPKRFTSEYREATQKAAEVRYFLGKQGLEQGRSGQREAAKDAYFHFGKALEWQPGYRDAENLMLEAQDLATLYVQIEPIPMHSRTLALSNEFFENQIAEYIASTTFNPFIRFFMPSQVASMGRNADQLVRMQFDDFVVGQAYVKETVVNRQRDSVVVGKVNITPDSTVNAYGTVKAEVHHFQKQITSTGLLDMKIIDIRTGRVVSQRKFPGTFVWYDYWGFFNGDERALEKADDRYLRKNREIPAPPPQDLFIEFTRPIFSQVTDYVSNFYRNY